MPGAPAAGSSGACDTDTSSSLLVVYPWCVSRLVSGPVRHACAPSLCRHAPWRVSLHVCSALYISIQCALHEGCGKVDRRQAGFASLVPWWRLRGKAVRGQPAARISVRGGERERRAGAQPWHRRPATRVCRGKACAQVPARSATAVVELSAWDGIAPSALSAAPACLAAARITLSGRSACRFVFSAREGFTPNWRMPCRTGGIPRRRSGTGAQRAAERGGGLRAAPLGLRGQRVDALGCGRRRGERGDVVGDGLHVRCGQLGEFLHHRRHRAGGGTMMGGSRLQVGEQGLLGPRHRCARQGGQGGRFPALGAAPDR